MSGNADLEHRLGSIEELLRRVDSMAEPSLRANVHELIELVMKLHGEGLERILELARAAGDPGEIVVRKLSEDELVAGLLVLYGLHPLGIEARVAQALDKVRPGLRRHGGGVELLTIEDGAVRLRLDINEAAHRSASLKQMIEEAVYQAAPDLAALTIEGAEDKQGFVPLTVLLSGQAVPAGKGVL